MSLRLVDSPSAEGPDSNLQETCLAAACVLEHHFAECAPISITRLDNWLVCTFRVGDELDRTIRFGLPQRASAVDEVLDGLVRFEACLIAVTGRNARPSNLPRPAPRSSLGQNVVPFRSAERSSDASSANRCAEEAALVMASKFEAIATLIAELRREAEVDNVTLTSIADRVSALGKVAVSFAKERT